MRIIDKIYDEKMKIYDEKNEIYDRIEIYDQKNLWP